MNANDLSQSSWSVFEVARVLGARKKILPIRVENAAIPFILREYIHLRIGDYAANRDYCKGGLDSNDVSTILASLRRILGNQRLS